MRREVHPTLTPQRALSLLLEVRAASAVTDAGPASAALWSVQRALEAHVRHALAAKRRRARRG